MFVHERLIDYGIPVLGSVVNDWERSTLTQVDRVLAVTEEGAESARRKHGVDAVPNYPGTDPVADRFSIRGGTSSFPSPSGTRGRRPWDYVELAKRTGKGILLVGN